MSSLSAARGECVRMVPHLHPTSVDCVPGCSVTLCAGRPAAYTLFVCFDFDIVIHLHLASGLWRCACVLCEVRTVEDSPAGSFTPTAQSDVWLTAAAVTLAPL